MLKTRKRKRKACAFSSAVCAKRIEYFATAFWRCACLRNSRRVLGLEATGKEFAISVEMSCLAGILVASPLLGPRYGGSTETDFQNQSTPKICCPAGCSSL